MTPNNKLDLSVNQAWPHRARNGFRARARINNAFLRRLGILAGCAVIFGALAQESGSVSDYRREPAATRALVERASFTINTWRCSLIQAIS